MRLRLPDQEIAVINKGKGGEEAADELLPFNRDGSRGAPSLVICRSNKRGVEGI